MSEITEKRYQEMKQKAVKYFGKNKKISSPAFGEIKITSKGFSHIERKNKNHKRPKKESYIRYLCFLHIEYVLSNSKLYQEFREYMEEVQIKKKGKKKTEKRIAYLYGFIAIVNHNKNRIKIIVKKIDGWNKYEFVSIIPLWKNEGYGNQLFFDNEEDFLKILEETTKKPSS